MDHLSRPSTLLHTPLKKIQFMNVPLAHLAVTMTTIVITLWEYIAHVMATPAYVITKRKQAVAILVLMLPSSAIVAGAGTDVTGTLGDQAVPAQRRTAQEKLSGPSFEEKMNVMCCDH